MKKLFFILFSLFLFNLPVFAQGINKVTIAWEKGLKPPYLMLDAEKQLVGIAVEMITEILSRKEIRVIHKIYPWKRCLSNIRHKTIDLVPNASYNKKRAGFAYYTKPLYETHLLLFYKKTNFKTPPIISNADDLKPYRVGGVLGFNYNQYKKIINIDDGVTTRERLVQMLHLDRVDFAILQQEVVLRLRKEGKIDLAGLGNVPDPIKPIKAFHVLTVKNDRGKKLQEIINTGIDQLLKDGTTNTIMNKYLR